MNILSICTICLKKRCASNQNSVEVVEQFCSEIKELQDYGIERIYHPDDGRSLGLQGTSTIWWSAVILQ